MSQVCQVRRGEINKKILCIASFASEKYESGLRKEANFNLLVPVCYSKKITLSLGLWQY